MTSATDLNLTTAASTREVRGHAQEVKFVLTEPLAERIRGWARQHLSADPHGTGPFGDEYETTSLYLDTTALDVFQGRGSYKRAKYRIRRYGASDRVFLERKLRSKVLLAKRRTAVALEDVSLVGDAPFDWDGRWFQARLSARRLAPACQVSYRRTARIGATASMRLTIDADLRARMARGFELARERNLGVFDGRVILELKFRGALPALFKQLLEEFRLAPQSFSKYRVAMSALTNVTRADRMTTSAKQIVCA
jgi:hypothetical protein